MAVPRLETRLYAPNVIGVDTGTRDGHFRTYPSSAWPRKGEHEDKSLGSCAFYDPRQRPWYMGASTGPKDIVLIVDKSDSMNNVTGNSKEPKWNTARRAVKDILGTFTLMDFVNVVVFSDQAEPLWKLSDLVRARTEHIEKLYGQMDKVTPGGSTNFTAGFEEAFRILTNACDGEISCSHCHKVILFLTDGMDTTGRDRKSIKPSQMASTVNEMQRKLEERTGARASIFTYSMTEEADDAIPRQLACANNGAWSFIGPNTNTFDAMNSYYLYFAGGRTELPIWVEPYVDQGGLGLLTTVAMPFFAKGSENAPDVFLGVVGHDVGLHELERGGVTQEQALNAIIDRSRQCIPSEITSCEQQIYRQAQDPLSECPDTVLAEDVDENKCFTFRDSAYKVFVEEVNWEEAKELCVEDGGQLVSILDEGELAFVARLAQTDGSWVGASRLKGHLFAWIAHGEPILDDSFKYWGVHEPFFAEDEEPCVAIDTRGVMRNLFVKSCTENASFICKYDSAESCGGAVRTTPKIGYFTVPPADFCRLEEVMDAIHPVPGVENLLSSDVVCPMGEYRSTEDVICCSNRSEFKLLGREMLPWFVIILVLVCVIFLAIIFCLRHRIAARCPGCCRIPIFLRPATET